MFRRALLLGALLSFLVPNVGAAQNDYVAGTVRFAESTIVGDSNVTSSGMGAFFLGAERGNPMTGSWEVEAPSATVNWTSIELKGVGSSPTNPSGSLVTTSPTTRWGESNYTRAAISADAFSADASFLIVPRGQGMFSVNAFALTSFPSDGETWTAGAASNSTTNVGSVYWDNLRQSFEVPAGDPLLRAQSSVDGTMQGDFTIFVWGADLKVRDQSGAERTHRSGSWSDNATGPGPQGTVRDEHWQFLRVHLADAHIRIRQDDGLAQWTAPELFVQTSGNVTFLKAQGTLESGNHVFQPNEETLSVVGHVKQRIGRSSASALSSDMRATEAQLSLAPAATLARDAGFPWLTLVVGVAAIGALGVGGWKAAPLGRDIRWAFSYRRADHAVSHDLAGALRRTQRLVERRPKSGEAWGLWADARLRHDGPRAIVEPLLAVEATVDQPAHVQFMLAVAFIQLGDDEKGYDCMEKAWQDEAFVRGLQEATGEFIRPVRPKAKPPQRPDDLRGYS